MNPKFLRIQWADQITSEPKKTTDFYSKLLGFGQTPVEEPNDCVSYCLTNEKGEEVFGIVDEINFQGWAPGWVLYFEVDDFEAQCEKAEKLGGTIIHKGKNQCLIRDPSGAPIVLNPPNAYTQSNAGDTVKE
ncbi:MAG: VOC family protein [Opitutaceae bacterium]